MSDNFNITAIYRFAAFIIYTCHLTAEQKKISRDRFTRRTGHFQNKNKLETIIFSFIQHSIEFTLCPKWSENDEIFEQCKEEIFREKDDIIQVLYLCDGQHKPQSAFGWFPVYA